MVHIFSVKVGYFYPEEDFLLVTPKGITVKTVRHLIAGRLKCCEKTLSFYYNTELFSEVHDKPFWDDWCDHSLYIIRPFNYQAVEDGGISGRIYLTKIKID